MLNSTKTQLFFLTAVQDKTLFASLDLVFDTEAEEHSLSGTEVNRFVFDDSKLPGHGPAILGEIYGSHPDPERYYVLIGHTDKVGDSKCNERLGENRATAAAAYLETLGVPRNQMIIASLGSVESQNHNGNDTLDRRLQVICIPNPYVIAAPALGLDAAVPVGINQKN